jgi:hypothetical protein
VGDVVLQLLKGCLSEIKCAVNCQVPLNQPKYAKASSSIETTGSKFADRLVGWMGLTVVITIVMLNAYLVIRYLL